MGAIHNWNLPTERQLIKLLDIACADDRQIQLPERQLYGEIRRVIGLISGNSYRITTMKIANLAGGVSQARSIRALNLLDYLVKDFGLPFYIEITTYEFLELFTRTLRDYRFFQNNVVSRMIMSLLDFWWRLLCSQPLLNDFYRELDIYYKKLRTEYRDYIAFDFESFCSLLFEEILFHPDDIKSRYKCTVDMKIGQCLRTNTADSRYDANIYIMRYYGEKGLLYSRNYDEESKEEIKAFTEFINKVCTAIASRQPEDRFKKDINLEIFYKVSGILSKRLDIALEKGGIDSDLEERIKKLASRTKHALEMYRCFMYGIPDRTQGNGLEDASALLQEKEAGLAPAFSRKSLICDDNGEGCSFAAPATFGTELKDTLNIFFANIEAEDGATAGGGNGATSPKPRSSTHSMALPDADEEPVGSGTKVVHKKGNYKVNIYCSDSLQVGLCCKHVDEQTIGLVPYISNICESPITDVSLAITVPKDSSHVFADLSHCTIPPNTLCESSGIRTLALGGSESVYASFSLSYKLPLLAMVTEKFRVEFAREPAIQVQDATTHSWDQNSAPL